MEARQVGLASCRAVANLLLGSNGGLWLLALGGGGDSWSWALGVTITPQLAHPPPATESDTLTNLALVQNLCVGKLRPKEEEADAPGLCFLSLANPGILVEFNGPALG